MRYLYIRHNASIMAMSIICPPEGPLDVLFPHVEHEGRWHIGSPAQLLLRQRTFIWTASRYKFLANSPDTVPLGCQQTCGDIPLAIATTVSVKYDRAAAKKEPAASDKRQKRKIVDEERALGLRKEQSLSAARPFAISSHG